MGREEKGLMKWQNAKRQGKGQEIIVEVKGREEIVLSLYNHLESLAIPAKAPSQSLLQKQTLLTSSFKPFYGSKHYKIYPSVSNKLSDCLQCVNP